MLFGKRDKEPPTITVTDQRAQHYTFKVEIEGFNQSVTYTAYSREDYERWKPFFDELKRRVKKP